MKLSNIRWHIENMEKCSAGIQVNATVFAEFWLTHGNLTLAGEIQKNTSVFWNSNCDWESFQREVVDLIQVELSQDLSQSHSQSTNVSVPEFGEWSLTPELEAELQAELREIESETAGHAIVAA